MRPTATLRAQSWKKRSGNPSAVMMDGVPVEFRCALDIKSEAQHYYVEHYPEQIHALLREQGLEPKF